MDEDANKTADADEAMAAAAAFAVKVQKMLDLKRADTSKMHTQTARENRNQLLRWADYMHNHETQIKQAYERVYLVASDLRIKFQSRYYSGYSKPQSSGYQQHSSTFLDIKDIKSLHEKHWAVEIDGRYYELLRSVYGSRFSSTNSVDSCDRRITARIFIGASHFTRAALIEIGKGIIATQTKYELTRDNCHRFVRVFITLAICPNHPEDTLPNLPLNVEELIATNFLNQKDGCQGHAGENSSSFLASIFFNSKEDDMHRASRLVGEGAEWTLRHEDLGTDLRLIIRRLTQKSVSDGETTTYLDEFDVKQEQTLYLVEHDSDLHFKCRTLKWSPYRSIVRFDKSSKYTIIPRSSKHTYKPEGPASGMIAGPYGVTLSKGEFKLLRPTELIRDNNGIWRDGNGERLKRPSSKLQIMLADVTDFFIKQDRNDFKYHLPMSELFNLAIRKTFKGILPVASVAVVGLVTAAMISPMTRPGRPERRKSKRFSAESTSESETETETGTETKSESESESEQIAAPKLLDKSKGRGKTAERYAFDMV